MPRKKKRPNGEGSISRRKDGRYEGQYTIQTVFGSKRKAVYGKTRAEVAEKLARAIAERDAGLVVDTRRTDTQQRLVLADVGAHGAVVAAS